MASSERSMLTTEDRGMLTALLEGQRSTEELLKAVISGLDRLTVEVGALKDQVSDLGARERHLVHKTAELEAEVSVLKQRRA